MRKIKSVRKGSGNNENFEVYLAGAFCPYKTGGKTYEDWRDFVIKKVNNEKISFYDPRKKSNQLCPGTFAMDDANGVLNTDILLHYRPSGYEDEGASLEQGIAVGCNLLGERGLDVRKKLIIYADDTSTPFPLHFSLATITFHGLEAAVDFLNKIESLEKFDTMPAYMDLMTLERVRRKI